MLVPTVDEVFKGYWTMLDNQLPPAEHDSVCHMAAHAECDWWGWAILEVVK